MLQVAEVQRERQLRLVGQALVAEHQHGMFGDRGLDRGEVVRGQGACQIDAADLTHEQVM